MSAEPRDVALIESPAAPAMGSSNDFAVAGRNAVKLAISLTVTWSVAFLIRFPIPRILGPERFGELTFAENFTSTFFMLLDLGIGTYIVKEIAVRPEHASDFWGGTTLVRLALSVLLFGIMGATLSVSHHSLEVQLTVLVFGIAQIFTSFGTTIAAMLQAITKVDGLAIANVASKFVWGAGLAAALFFTRALPYLALPLLISEAVKFVFLYYAAGKSLNLAFRVDRVATKVVLLASLPFFISGGAINIGGRLNVAVLEFVTPDKREVGWFGASQNLASLTMLLSPLLGAVLMPLLARAKTRSDEEVYEILRRTIEGLLAVVIPMTLVVSLGAEFWIRLAFRSAYDEAALSLKLLAVGFILIYLAMALSILLIMLGHSWSVSMISLGAMPVRPILVAFLAGPCARHYGPGGAAFGAALAEVITSLGIVAAHFIPLRSRALDRRLVVAALKSLAVAGFVTVLDGTVLLRMGHVRLVVDMTIYLVLVVLTGAVKLKDIKRAIRGMKSARAPQA
jgi:O-antigen/teichoic acid export membrane protein